MMNTKYDTFVQLFKAFGFEANSFDDFKDGVLVGSFLATLQNSKLNQYDFISGQSQTNFQMILAQIERFKKQELQKIEQEGNEKPIGNQFKSNEFLNKNWVENSEIIYKVLRQCFILSAKAKNSRDYIEKVLTLQEKSQIFLAEILRSDNKLLQTLPMSPVKQNQSFQQSVNQIPINSGKKWRQLTSQIFSENNQEKQEFSLIQKLYQLDEDNEKLNNNLKGILEENKTLQQSLTKFQIQNAKLTQCNLNLKQHIQILKQQLKNNRLQNMLNEQQKTKKNLNDAQKQTRLLKQKIEIINFEKQATKRRYQRKIIELEEVIRILKLQKQNAQQKVQDLKQQVKHLFDQCVEYQNQQKNLWETIQEEKRRNQVYRENQEMLRFQINYKNQQIQGLKQNIADDSNGVFQGSQSYLSQHKSNSCRILKNQFSSTFNSPVSQSKSSFNIDFQDSKSLKFKVKELEEQKQKLIAQKKKNKELQYEKKKLMKTLKQYQLNRGEQNEILLRIIYEMHSTGRRKQKLISDKMMKFVSMTTMQGE